MIPTYHLIDFMHQIRLIASFNSKTVFNHSKIVGKQILERMISTRILYLGKNQEFAFAASWYYMLKQIAKNHDLITHGPTIQYKSKWISGLDSSKLEVLSDLIHKFGISINPKSPLIEADIVKIAEKTTPDIILIGTNFPPVPYWRNLNQVDIPKAMVISDPHYRFEDKLHFASNNKISLCLFDCRFAMKRNAFLNWKKKNQDIFCKWLPHSVDSNVFRDYGFERVYDVVSAGMTKESIYPLRNKMRKALREIGDIRFLLQRFAMPLHAKEELRSGVKPSKALIRTRYAKFLSTSKIFAFDASIYRYPVQKYFEGMGADTLVMAPTPRDAEYLNFVPGENFVEINEHNFIDRIYHYLDNTDERLEIARRGRETIEKHHTVEIRETQLTDYMKLIL